LISRHLPTDIERTVGEMPGLGMAADGIEADLANPATAHRLGRKATAREPLHLLVNHAGVSIRGPVWEVSYNDWKTPTNVNQGAPFILAWHATRAIIGTGIRGWIGAIGASHCQKNALVYDPAKAAVQALTRNRSYEAGTYGVSVSCDVPGPIRERPGERPMLSAARKPPPSSPSDGPDRRRTPPPTATSAVPSPPGRRGKVC
jgi:NAD(P)-dependent dehydrogenase (short-subunit alcohol dehydrogenase family)